MRTKFLTTAGALGLLIGLAALLVPGVILTGKGVASTPELTIWVREVGVLIVGLSTTVVLVRNEPDSPTLRAVLWGNAVVHAGLLPVEVLGWLGGVIPRLGGVAPNTLLHLVFAVSFIVLASRSAPAPATSPVSLTGP